MEIPNILQSIPANLDAEVVETLASAEYIEIERIVSHGHSSPPEGWYDQPRHEWVIVLQGHAVIGFEQGEDVELKVGNYLNIPAHRRHKVRWTDPAQVTIWLAIHYSGAIP